METPTKGTQRNVKLDQQQYNNMLDVYYEEQEWNSEGIPTKEILSTLDLTDIASRLGL